MNGLRIRELPGQPGTSAFDLLFSPIVGDLPSHRWLVRHDCFDWPYHWTEIEHDAIDSQRMQFGEFYLIDNAFLMRHIRLVSDFWNELYGFDAEIDWAAWVARYAAGGPDQYRFIASTINLCFTNVDGAYWDVYAKRAELLSVVRNRCPDATDVNLEAGLY